MNKNTLVLSRVSRAVFVALLLTLALVSIPGYSETAAAAVACDPTGKSTPRCGSENDVDPAPAPQPDGTPGGGGGGGSSGGSSGGDRYIPGDWVSPGGLSCEWWGGFGSGCVITTSASGSVDWRKQSQKFITLGASSIAVHRYGQNQCPRVDTGSRRTTGFTYTFVRRAPVIKDLETGAWTNSGPITITPTISCVRLNVIAQDEKCLVGGSSSLKMLAPRKETIGTAPAKMNGTGSTEYDKCRSATRVVANMKMNGIPEKYNFGRYELRNSTTYRWNTVEYYGADLLNGGQVAKPKIVKRGPIKTSNPKVGYVQILCSGVTSGSKKAAFVGSNHEYTLSDCPAPTGGGNGGSKHPYTCSFSGDPRINGNISKSATVFRDGKLRGIAWKKPKLNAKTQGSLKTSTIIARKGTPWNATGITLGAKKNHFLLTNNKNASILTGKAGTGWMDGLVYKNLKFGATWASTKGEATVLSPTYKWEGKFITKITYISSVDVVSGTISTKTATTAINSSAKCVGDNMRITAVRSVASK